MQVISQYDNWCNAFGEKIDHSIFKGTRLTINGEAMVGGCKFYSFKETPKGYLYWSIGFKTLRSYDA